MMPRARLKAQKVDAAQTRFSGQPLPGGGAWITSARNAAKSRVLAMGLPVKRDEYWRYTNPARLLEADVLPASLVQDTAETEIFSRIDQLKLVFVDGVLDPQASDDMALAGVEITTLDKAASSDLHWARDLYGALETRGQSPVERPLAAVNTAYAVQGLLIRATGKVEKPVALIYQRSAKAAEALVHHVIRVESGAELTLLEVGPCAARFNQVIEADIADGGVLHHVRAQGRDHERAGVAHLFARLGARAAMKSFSLTANGALIRNEGVIWLDGAGGSAHVAGAAVGDGTFHQDDTIFVTHRAPDCESRQVFKKVLRRGAVGVFQGKILVERAAQKTDGYQISQALLLDEDAQFLAKPELEIYADDVKCSHGSTSGEIDQTQLFYLRSRGLPEAVARNLLVLAFLAEALDEIADPALAEDLRCWLEGWFSRHAG